MSLTITKKVPDFALPATGADPDLPVGLIAVGAALAAALLLALAVKNTRK